MSNPNDKTEPKALYADNVIAWLVANICHFEYYVELFKKRFWTMTLEKFLDRIDEINEELSGITHWMLMPQLPTVAKNATVKKGGEE